MLSLIFRKIGENGLIQFQIRIVVIFCECAGTVNNQGFRQKVEIGATAEPDPEQPVFPYGKTGIEMQTVVDKDISSDKYGAGSDEVTFSDEQRGKVSMPVGREFSGGTILYIVKAGGANQPDTGPLFRNPELNFQLSR